MIVFPAVAAIPKDSTCRSWTSPKMGLKGRVRKFTTES
jgi:hypothetical protein